MNYPVFCLESAFWKGCGGTFFAEKGSPAIIQKSFLIRCFFPTLVAHSDVGVVSADEDLATGSDDVTVLVDTGIDGGFVTARADGFDFGNGVGNLK